MPNVWISASTLERLRAAAVFEFEPNARPELGGFTIQLADHVFAKLETLKAGRTVDETIAAMLDEYEAL